MSGRPRTEVATRSSRYHTTADTGPRRDKRVSPSAGFWVLTGFLSTVFVLGGSARGDVASLIFLRPIAVLTCAWGLIRLDAETVRRWRGLLSLASAIIILPALHLVPLPSAIWQSLPGHEIVFAISKSVGIAGSARPLSLSPLDTLNAEFSLFVPLATLLLAVQLPKRDRHRLLFVVLGLGALSAAIGALQAINPDSAALRFYRVDNATASVGLFANRNHQALLLACMLPLAAVFTAFAHADRRIRGGILICIVCMLVPLLLVTGSRAGLITGFLGVLSLFALRSPARDGDGPKTGWIGIGSKWFVPAIVLFVLFLGAILQSNRAEAFQRLFASTPLDDARWKLWQPAIKATLDYMPLGSGIGSFVSTYQVYETRGLLSPTYRNHAHNDFIEIAMTGGVPALVLLAVAVVGWARLVSRWIRQPRRSQEVLYGRLGAVMVLLFGVASFVDYPARVPTLACVLTLAAVWMFGDPAARGHLRQ